MTQSKPSNTEEWFNQLLRGNKISDEVAATLVLARTIEYLADTHADAIERHSEVIDQAANKLCQSYENHQ